MHKTSLDNLTKAKLTGQLSKKSVSKMVNICQNWSDAVDEYNDSAYIKKFTDKRQLVLLTLTLSAPQKDSDVDIKRKLLNNFIIELIRESPRIKYLWKAEAQDNGNIHFHLIVDKFVNKNWYQSNWNRIQRNYGYHPDQTIDEFNCGLPSTRIESLKNKNNGIAYVAKYISKNECKRPITGRLWGCSDSLRELKPIEYRVNKNDVLEIVKISCDSYDQLFMNGFCLYISKPLNFDLLRPYLHTYGNFQLIVKYNCELLHSVEVADDLSDELSKQTLPLTTGDHNMLMQWSQRFRQLEKDFE